MEVDLEKLPEIPGVYLLKNKEEKIIYIGKAVNLQKRVKSYWQKGILQPKTKQMIKEVKIVETIKTESEFEALLLEARLIKREQPKYNTIWRDDKSPLYIKITAEEFPKVFMVRQENDQRSIYFGPFPSAKIVREALRFLRKVFPYCTNKRIGPKPCFYSHLKLCNPCPNIIIKSSPGKRRELKKQYLKNIKNLKSVLNGKSKTVIRKLKQEMRKKAHKTKFEEAKILKRQIERLEYLTKPRLSVFEYLKNPNLYEDQRKKELSELKKIIRVKGETCLADSPRCPPWLGETGEADRQALNRIEGYDVSNIMGRKSAGAMIVFLHGEPEKSQYRKFRIKSRSTPDDTAMIREILTRRLKHKDWPYPDLILIDGGKGQVASALKILKKFHLINIPVLGLAKKLEKIVLPCHDRFYTIELESNSSALKLLQRIRDEAHRFARKYHLLLRKKSMLY